MKELKLELKVDALTLAEAIERHKAGTLVGVFRMTNEDYHNAPGISKSNLDQVEVSPATYRYSILNPEPPTSPMEFGSALHTAILEPEEFDNRYAVTDLDRRGTKAWDAFELANPGKIILKKDGDKGAQVVKEMATVAISHSRSQLLAGFKELAFFWKHPETGILCKVKPDNLTTKGVITDYKSCAWPVYPQRIASSVFFKMRYHVGGAFYLDGVVHALDQSGKRDLLPVMPNHFVLYAQEKTAPYLVKPWDLGESSIALGRRTYEANLRKIKECDDKKAWPGYPEKIEPIEMPDYAWNGEREELSENDGNFGDENG